MPTRSSARLLLAFVVFIVLVSCGRSTPYGIVFASDRDGNFDIFRMDSDGENVERLTNTPDQLEQAVRVSPDGANILFDRGGSRLDREVYRLDVSTAAVSQLTDFPAYDFAGAWSPGGDQIAFISDRDGGFYRLYLMNPDGSDQRHVPLATDPEFDVPHVSWSPDGQRLVYEGRGHLYSQSSVTPTIFVVDLSTLEVTRVTGPEQGACMQPDWSPDGAWIAMVCVKATPAGSKGEIYLIHPDGSGFRQVTTRPAGAERDLPPGALRPWVREPRWSPDGDEIVYSAAVDGPWNIYIIGADGKNNRRLTDHDAVDWDLSTYRLP